MGLMINLNPQIIQRLTHEFNFKTRGEHLREGLCPSCNKKTLWTWIDKPGMVQCNRTNNCEWQMTSKELFPDLFENLNKKYPATKENKNQTADAYLSLIRGFDTSKLQGWYIQGKYWHPHGDKGTASVKFFLDSDNGVYWERLVDDVTITDEDGDKEVRNKSFKGKFKGLWWQPPALTIEPEDEVYFCEGILDAIALNLNGFKAVAIMSSGTFPTEAIKPHLDKRVKWVLALDNDATGRRCLQKHAKTLREMDERVGAALSSSTETKADWNDLHKAGKLSADDMKQYRFLGRVELAQNPTEKAMQMWKHETKKTYFVFVFANSTYSFKINKEEFEKAFDKEMELNGADRVLRHERVAFIHASKILEIATFRMGFLYFQEPDNGEEGQFFFRLNFKNKSPEKQLAFPGKVLMSHSDFKKGIANKTPSALFKGKGPDLDYIFEDWMAHIPKFVKTLDFIGYHPDSKAYVFSDYAVERGQIINLNTESFFELKNTGIKSMVDIKQKLNTKMKADWIEDYQTAFGTGGMVALSWWFGCLFVEQVRNKHRSYPFLEVVGEAGSGKSDMVDFLWKLLGKEGESFNPNSSTLAGRTRKMAEVSNLPVVFNETDNEKVAEDRHGKQFNWDEQKDLFDGEFGRVTGIKSQDNSTKKPNFKAGLMIVQNIPVSASEAIMTRICHLQFDRSHHSLAGKHASDRLNMLPVMDVSGFLLHSTQKAEGVLKLFDEKFVRHKKTLQANDKIKLQRIIENHAKIMAFADCLSLVLAVPEATITQVHTAVIAMAETRQESLNEEHPVVTQFWATFDYINSLATGTGNGTVVTEDRVNHSLTPDELIAVNLEHFRSRCADLKLELLDSKELRRHLPSSRKRLYLRNEPIRSRLENRTIRCWIFKRA